MPAPGYKPNISGPTQRVRITPDVELAYIEQGEGPPMVFIPHWTFTKEVFEHQLEKLSAHYRVIAYDPRSQGDSSFSLEGNDYITHAKDLELLLAALNIERPVLAGWGAGALAAWGYVTMHGPEAVSGLVVIDMPPKSLSVYDYVWTEGTLDELAAIHTLFLRDAAGHANFMRRYLETVMVQRVLEPAELDWLLGLSLSTNPLVTAQLYASCMFADLTNAAVAVARARPMLFFLSQDSAERAVPYLNRMMPEAKYVTFGGRMMFWEYPEAFNHVVTEFLNLNMARAEVLTAG